MRVICFARDATCGYGPKTLLSHVVVYFISFAVRWLGRGRVKQGTGLGSLKVEVFAMPLDEVLLIAANHAPPGCRRIPFEVRVLTMRFKMFKDGDVVGEVEKVAIAKHVGGGKYEYVVEVDGYVFDVYEVVVRDMDGRVIYKKKHDIAMKEGQAMIYKLTMGVS
jgi:hypothetical protein